MERYTELLYWCDYDQYIHYDKNTDTYSYDPDMPKRARKSHEMWLKHNNW